MAIEYFENVRSSLNGLVQSLLGRLDIVDDTTTEQFSGWSRQISDALEEAFQTKWELMAAILLEDVRRLIITHLDGTAESTTGEAPVPHTKNADSILREFVLCVLNEEYDEEQLHRVHGITAPPVSTLDSHRN